MRLPRIILADDHTLFVEALRKLAAPHVEVVATVGDGRALLETAQALKPDVVVIDVGMPLLNGLDAGRELKKRLPNVKLIFLTMSEDPDLAAEAMKSGASGYLLKTSAGSELFSAIREALGEILPHAANCSSHARVFHSRSAGCKVPKVAHATAARVLQLLAEGKPMKIVADILRIAPRTVAFHKYRVMQDLGLKSNAELIQFAIKNRIIIQ